MLILSTRRWIGHILKRLHLLDDTRCKRGMDGITYAVKPTEVLDMTRRYSVSLSAKVDRRFFSVSYENPYSHP